MRRVTCFLLGLGIAYSILLLLSIFLILPRQLPGGVGAYILEELTDTEPEGRFETTFLSLRWLVTPLAAMALCLSAWLADTASVRFPGLRRTLSRMGFVTFVVASFFPALLVVRALLLYHALGFDSPDVLRGLTDFIHSVKLFVDPALMLGWRGVWVVPIVIFAETGLFFGFFLPGDSLLLSVGVLGAVGRMDLSLLIVCSVLAAILGDQVGYATGLRMGDSLSYRFHPVREGIGRARDFYAKHGGMAVVVARFVPVVRTFAPIVAGAVRMNYFRFTIFNIAGGVLWVIGVTLIGFFVGRQVPWVANYFELLVLAIVVSSPLTWILTWTWGRRSSHSRIEKTAVLG